MNPDLIAALRAGKQADIHGETVTVSRQAVEEAAEILSNLYALGLMTEEMGEALQIIGKGLRFGLDHARGSDGATARSMLPEELGDVEASIHYACLDGIAPFSDVIRRREFKKARLLDPESRDDQGGRLAPEPRGQRR
jgi:hypothetical protein